MSKRGGAEQTIGGARSVGVTICNALLLLGWWCVCAMLERERVSLVTGERSVWWLRWGVWLGGVGSASVVGEIEMWLLWSANACSLVSVGSTVLLALWWLSVGTMLARERVSVYTGESTPLSVSFLLWSPNAWSEVKLRPLLFIGVFGDDSTALMDVITPAMIVSAAWYKSCSTAGGLVGV